MSTDVMPTDEPVDKNKMSVDHPNFLRPERLIGETDEQYTLRKKVNKLFIKGKKKGTLAWIAKDTMLPIYGEKGTETEKKIIGHKVSEGFTYNKEKFNKALEAWQKKQEDLDLLKQSIETNISK